MPTKTPSQQLPTPFFIMVSQRYDIQNEQRPRKVVSDVSTEISELNNKVLESSMNNGSIEEVEQVECECCGMKEDCTHDYIKQVRDSFSGKWVCGLCSEAVKERIARAPNNTLITMQEAVGFHGDFCQSFNTTTRLNPKLSLTHSMRDLARRFSQKRNSNNLGGLSRLGRSSSCVPSIHLHR